MGTPTSTLWAGPFPIEGLADKFLLLLCFIEIPFLNANSVDPDQTPRSVVKKYYIRISVSYRTKRRRLVPAGLAQTLILFHSFAR